MDFTASLNNKRIIKNTAMLYIRMAVLMVVTLYITRIVLNALGEEDYGIYNIVGSVVVSLVFIQNALSSSTQRFLSYEMGKGANGNVASVFSAAVNIHVMFIIIVVLFLETFGLWFLNNVLTIPEERYYAANVAFHFSIAAFVFNIIRIPYNAVIISYEKMDIYAILSVAEGLLKLIIAYALIVASSDKLILYSIMIFVITLCISIIYIVYCKCKYKTICCYSFDRNNNYFREMLSFLGWNMLGGITGVATNEGPNYLMNIFLGVKVNAAMGIAKQVSSAVYQFTSNFQTAFNPQVVKAYASNETVYLQKLINDTSKISFFLMLLFALPIILCSTTIFNLWLLDVPQYAIDFSICMMLAQLVSAISSPLWMLAHAIGNIKKYQISLSIISLLILPLSWIMLYLQCDVVNVIAVQIIINVFVVGYRLFYLRGVIQFPVRNYLTNVVFKCLLCLVLIIPVPILINTYTQGVLGVAVTTASCIVISCIVFFYIGLTKKQRSQTYAFINNKIHRKNLTS